MIVRRTVGMLMLLAGLMPCAVAQCTGTDAAHSRRQDDGRTEEGGRGLQGAPRRRPDRPALVGAAARARSRRAGAADPAALLNKSVLGPHLTEFAILIAARRWTNNWEWNAHAPAAATAGVKAEIIAALAEGRRPDAMSEDEAIVYDLCAELQSNQSVSDHDLRPRPRQVRRARRGRDRQHPGVLHLSRHGDERRARRRAAEREAAARAFSAIARLSSLEVGGSGQKHASVISAGSKPDVRPR